MKREWAHLFGELDVKWLARRSSSRNILELTGLGRRVPHNVSEHIEESVACASVRIKDSDLGHGSAKSYQPCRPNLDHL